MADEWTVVNSNTKRKVAKRRSADRPTTKSQDETEKEGEVAPELVVSHLTSCCQHLKFSQFYDSFVRAWRNHVKNNDDDDTYEEVVCYGIGNFAHRSSNFSGPLWQLALALELKTLCLSIPMVYYDPLVTPLERQVLQDHYQIKVLSNNERGIRNKTSLFFMPHCPKGLYENVLWANWNRLDTIGIIGNSLVTYVERATTTSSTSTQQSCLELIQPFVQEQLISYSKKDVKDLPGHFEAAFNDTYFTWISGSAKDWPERPKEPSQDGQNEVL